jgi:hypothetical protein
MMGESDQLIAVDRHTGEQLWSGKAPIGAEYSPSGRLLVFPTEGTGLNIVELGTWTETRVEEDFGNVRGIAFNAEETRIALGNSDRLLIFDLVNLTMVQVLEIGGVSDIHWIDDETLLIGTNTGLFGTVSLSTEEFLDMTRARLRRSFTPAECATYRIDPCPSHEAIRSR